MEAGRLPSLSSSTSSKKHLSQNSNVVHSSAAPKHQFDKYSKGTGHAYDHVYSYNAVPDAQRKHTHTNASNAFLAWQQAANIAKQKYDSNHRLWQTEAPHSMTKWRNTRGPTSGPTRGARLNHPSLHNQHESKHRS